MADIKTEAIALAALFQCCSQIYRVANTGYQDDNALACLMRSIVVTNPKTIEDIYSLDNLKVGFSQIIDSFDKGNVAKTINTIEITKMALKIISLSIQLMRNGKVFDRLSFEIDDISQRILLEHENFLEADTSVINSSEIIHQFGTLYKSLISPNFSKLLIYGNEQCLRAPENQEKIRALLLAGIRAVILWRQVGGRRRFLVFRRNQIVDYAKKHL